MIEKQVNGQTKDDIGGEQVRQLLEKFSEALNEKTFCQSDIKQLNADAFLLSIGEKKTQQVLFTGQLRRKSFKGLFEALAYSKATGELRFISEDVQKSIFFKDGQTIFSRSNQKDDRLGEVIYRSGFISIMELATAAVQVTKTRRFGSVLIESDIFSHYDLWKAMLVQLESVLSSIFFLTEAEVSFHDGVGIFHNMKLCLDTPLGKLLEKCEFRANLLDQFILVLKGGGLVRLDDQKDRTPLSDFQKEFLSLMGPLSRIDDLLNKSKLANAYVLNELMHLNQLGFVHVDNWRYREEDSAEGSVDDGFQSLLSRYNDTFSVAYNFLLAHDVNARNHVASYFNNPRNSFGLLFEGQSFVENSGSFKFDAFLACNPALNALKQEQMDVYKQFFLDFKMFLLFEVAEFLPKESYQELENILIQMEPL